MDLEQLKKQAETAKKAIRELGNTNELFGKALQEKLRSVPEEQKNSIEKMMNMTKQAIELAKSGKSEEAEELIKKFQDER